MTLLQGLEAELALYRAPLLRGDGQGGMESPVLTWVMGRIGARNPASVFMAELGVSRIEIVPGDADEWLWRPSPEAPEDRLGGPALVLPVRDAAGTLIDLVALHPHDNSQYWLRLDMGRMLGEAAMDAARVIIDVSEGEPPVGLRVFETPMDKLRAFAADIDAYGERVRSAKAEIAALKAAAGDAPLDEVFDPGDAAGVARTALISMLAGLRAQQPEGFEMFGTCVLAHGRAGIEFTLGACRMLLVDNPAYGVVLGKELEAARRKRRNAERKLPPVFARQGPVVGGWLPPGDAPGSNDGVVPPKAG